MRPARLNRFCRVCLSFSLHNMPTSRWEERLRICQWTESCQKTRVSRCWGIYARCFRPNARHSQVSDTESRHLSSRSQHQVTSPGPVVGRFETSLQVHDALMKSSIPPTLTVSPMSIECPLCDAEPGRHCMTTAGGFAAVHVQRIQEAARINYKQMRNRKARPR